MCLTNYNSVLLQGLAAAVRAASRVVVVGGGPLGVELAGEILTVSCQAAQGAPAG